MPEDALIVGAFLGQAVLISLSGVMAPGPVTAVTMAAGTRAPHAGALVAVGHGIVEFPLMVVIVLVAGAGSTFEAAWFRIATGLVGGLFLLFMGVGMLRSSPDGGEANAKLSARSPVVVGIVLSAGNPYFLVWWASVGLALATRAVELGILAFVLFAVAHWLCDFFWLEALSFAASKGSKLLGRRMQQIVLLVCGTALMVFGAMFLWDAGTRWLASA